jgi:hypothetical protein
MGKGWGGIKASFRKRIRPDHEYVEKGFYAQCEFCKRVLKPRKRAEEDTKRSVEYTNGLKARGEYVDPNLPWDSVAWALQRDGALIEASGFCTYCEKIVDKATKPQAG